jgi:hypothetical protein
MTSFQEDFLQTIVGVHWNPLKPSWVWQGALNGGRAPLPGELPTVDAPVSEADANATWGPPGTFYDLITPIGTLSSSANIGDRSIMDTVEKRKALVNGNMLFATLTGTYGTVLGVQAALCSVHWTPYFAVGRYLIANPAVDTATVTFGQRGYPPIYTYTITRPPAFSNAALASSGASDVADPAFVF